MCLVGGLAAAPAAAERGTKVVAYPGRGEVALTFDDGPHPNTTRSVIRVLEQHGVRGTFFVVGRGVERNRVLLRQAHRDGHSIQNHTWSHPNLRRISDRALRQELVRTSNAIERVTGERPRVFRPPYGATERRVVQGAERLGLRQLMWGAAPSRMEASSKEMVAEIVAQARRAKAQNKGLVVLLHDGSGNRTGTVKALPQIIEALRDQGWTFVVVK
jgi:peptidoglycan-N-acetylglucosamine deacetylase